MGVPWKIVKNINCATQVVPELVVCMFPLRHCRSISDMGGHRKQQPLNKMWSQPSAYQLSAWGCINLKLCCNQMNRKLKTCSCLLKTRLSLLYDWYLKACFVFLNIQVIINAVKFRVECSMWAFSSCAFNCSASSVLRKDSSHLITQLGIRAYWMLAEPPEQRQQSSEGAVSLSEAACPGWCLLK